MAEDTKIIKNAHPKNAGAINTFAILELDDSDFSFGLRHLKKRAKQQYRKLIKKYHPDLNGNCNTGSIFKRLTIAYKRAMKLNLMPLTIDNIEMVLDVTKGYKSTNDIELPWWNY